MANGILLIALTSIVAYFVESLWLAFGIAAGCILAGFGLFVDALNATAAANQSVRRHRMFNLRMVVSPPRAARSHRH